MKKFFSVLLVMAMVMSMTYPVFASEPTADTIEPAAYTIADDDTISPYSTMSLSFTSLAPGSCRYSTAVYSIVDSDAHLSISSCTWTPITQDIIIGYYNIDTGVIYGVRFEGGSIVPYGINSVGVPDGEYRIVVKNAGTKTVTGVLNFSVT